jgi:hypothetical protein
MGLIPTVSKMMGRRRVNHDLDVRAQACKVDLSATTSSWESMSFRSSLGRSIWCD